MKIIKIQKHDDSYEIILNNSENNLPPETLLLTEFQLRELAEQIGKEFHFNLCTILGCYSRKKP